MWDKDGFLTAKHDGVMVIDEGIMLETHINTRI